MFRLLRILLDFLPQPLDMYRERLLLRFTVASPDAVEQVFFLQCCSFVFDQQFQQLKFLFRDIDRCCIHSERLRDIVQFQIVAYNFIQCIFSFENAVDLGDQNIDIIRLTDVIIRADLQAF